MFFCYFYFRNFDWNIRKEDTVIKMDEACTCIKQSCHLFFFFLMGCLCDKLWYCLSLLFCQRDVVLVKKGSRQLLHLQLLQFFDYIYLTPPTERMSKNLPSSMYLCNQAFLIILISNDVKLSLLSETVPHYGFNSIGLKVVWFFKPISS